MTGSMHGEAKEAAPATNANIRVGSITLLDPRHKRPGKISKPGGSAPSTGAWM
jgi:hypothetical protein